jgi:hypothetical protein
VSISTFTLEGPCRDGHFGRGYMLDAAEDFLGDVSGGSDSVPAVVIAFGEEAVTVYCPPADMPWREFAEAALDLCQAREDVYGIALVRPHGGGAFIYTCHFEDGQGTIDHGFGVPEARYYTHVPQAELN